MRHLVLLGCALGLCACGGGAPPEPPAIAAIPVSSGGDLVVPPGVTLPTAAMPPSMVPGGARPPNPAMPGDLPPDPLGPLRAHARCEAACVLDAVVPALKEIDRTGPAAVWSHELSAKAKLTLPADSAVDVFGVVLAGAVAVAGTGQGDATHALSRWGAFHAPGGGVTLSAEGAPATVALAVVGDAPLEKLAPSGKRGWKKRAGVLAAVDLGARPDLAWAGGAFHARIGFEGEKRRASLGILMGSADAPVAAHQHDGSWEVLVPLRAAGTAERGSERLPIADGVVVAIPKGVVHAWQPDGTKPLVALQLYVPPGPEQRFKSLASAASPSK